jgi:phage gp45-like
VKAQIFLDKNGKITIDCDSDLDINSSDNVIIDANSNVDINASADVDIDATGKITQDGTAIELNGNSKRFVTYSELNTALQLLITALNTHVHTGVTTGPGSSGSPATPLTLDISASETTTIKTGG